MFIFSTIQSQAQIIDTVQHVSQIATNSPAMHFNVLEVLIKGGPIMIPLAVALLLALYVFFERFFTIWHAGKTDKSLLLQIRQYLIGKNTAATITVCKSNNSPVSRMFEKGLLRFDRPLPEIESALENAGKIEIAKLEKHTSILGIVAGIAPMLGFVGTIIGVIQIFFGIAEAGEISISVVASGLYVKMITSAAGLIIGIFAFILHHILRMMIDGIAFRMESDALELIELIQAQKPAANN